jgi:DNA polymerase-3 subunit gamma/tau
MSYQVIARKWRPNTFLEVVGQNHIVQTLQNAISIKRIGHAYLFAGSRGVGKTSTARIFARAINCKDGPRPNPCNECESCQEILASRSMDVIEIDGASNTSVDDVRELRENVKYAPAKTKYKIYIIDEVHMLSKSAFNALLKTLEEPPPHLIFIFATTELNKLPETILSRCQYFEFKQIGSGDMVKQLSLIAKSEGIEISLDGLKRISHAAEGSLRDAESLLDQTVSYCGKRVEDDQVSSLLGMAGQELIGEVVDRIIDRDSEGLLALYQEVIQKGQDIRMFCRELQEYFRNLAIVKVAKDSRKLIDLQEEDISFLQKQAKRIEVEEIQYLFNTLLKIDYDLKTSPVPTLVLEMALIRMSRYQPVQLLEDIVKKLSSLGLGEETMAPSPAVVPAKTRVQEAKPEPEKKVLKHEVKESVTKEDAGTDAAEDVWERILEKVREKREPLFNYLATGSEMVRLDPTTLRIGCREKWLMERLNMPENISIIREAILEELGSPREVKLESIKASTETPEIPKTNEDQSQAREAPREMPGMDESSTPKIIQDAVEIFNGTII